MLGHHSRPWTRSARNHGVRDGAFRIGRLASCRGGTCDAASPADRRRRACRSARSSCGARRPPDPRRRARHGPPLRQQRAATPSSARALCLHGAALPRARARRGLAVERACGLIRSSASASSCSEHQTPHSLTSASTRAGACPRTPPCPPSGPSSQTWRGTGGARICVWRWRAGMCAATVERVLTACERVRTQPTAPPHPAARPLPPTHAPHALRQRALVRRVDGLLRHGYHRPRERRHFRAERDGRVQRLRRGHDARNESALQRLRGGDALACNRGSGERRMGVGAAPR